MTLKPTCVSIINLTVLLLPAVACRCVRFDYNYPAEISFHACKLLNNSSCMHLPATAQLTMQLPFYDDIFVSTLLRLRYSSLRIYQCRLTCAYFCAHPRMKIFHRPAAPPSPCVPRMKIRRRAAACAPENIPHKTIFFQPAAPTTT